MVALYDKEKKEEKKFNDRTDSKRQETVLIISFRLFGGKKMKNKDK